MVGRVNSSWVVRRAGSGAPWLASQPVVAAAAIVLSSWV